MEPVTTALAGIALVKKSVDFIKSNISTCQDIGQMIGHVENAMIGEQQCVKAREGKDQFATENIAEEVINAKLAREHLQEMKNLVNLRFGHGTWDEILNLRKKRIDERKQKKKEALVEKNRKKQEIMDILTYFLIGLGVCLIAGLIIYVFLVIL